MLATVTDKGKLTTKASTQLLKDVALLLNEKNAKMTIEVFKEEVDTHAKGSAGQYAHELGAMCKKFTALIEESKAGDCWRQNGNDMTAIINYDEKVIQPRYKEVFAEIVNL